MLKGQMQDGENGGPGTVVGVNVALSGTLKDQNDISVHGMVDGEVVSDRTVTVGESAQVKGPVKGKVVTVAGVIRGAIDASEKLEVLETGKIYGSITTGDLVVRSGAQISGKITMGMDDNDAVETAEIENEESSEDKDEDQATIDAIEEAKAEAKEDILAPDEE